MTSDTAKSSRPAREPRLHRTSVFRCAHGSARPCGVCDAPIPYVLTKLARQELHAARLEEWHQEQAR